MNKMSNYQSGQIMKKQKDLKLCHHKHLIPLEYSFSRKSWPNGFKADPDYSPTNVIGADTMRVKIYFCLDCKCEVKAPNPGSCKKDIL
jgi:hypothetical protein